MPSVLPYEKYVFKNRGWDFDPLPSQEAEMNFLPFIGWANTSAFFYTLFYTVRWIEYFTEILSLKTRHVYPR